MAGNTRVKCAPMSAACESCFARIASIHCRSLSSREGNATIANSELSSMVVIQSFAPHLSVRKLVRFPRGRLDGDAVPRLHGRHIAGAPNRDGLFEMLVEVIDEFDNAPLHRAGHRDEVEH